jgi:hypothetical protein
VRGKTGWIAGTEVRKKKKLSFSFSKNFLAQKLAQKLGQLQPFIALLPQECMRQRASFGPT